VLADDVDLARYFETAAKGAKKPKNVANWILNDLQSALSGAGKTINDCPIPPESARRAGQLDLRAERLAATGQGSFRGYVFQRQRCGRDRERKGIEH